MDEKTWDNLVRFKRRLKGRGGQVTIPTEDFLALMDEARKWRETQVEKKEVEP